MWPAVTVASAGFMPLLLRYMLGRPTNSQYQEGQPEGSEQDTNDSAASNDNQFVDITATASTGNQFVDTTATSSTDNQFVDTTATASTDIQFADIAAAPSAEIQFADTAAAPQEAVLQEVEEPAASSANSTDQQQMALSALTTSIVTPESDQQQQQVRLHAEEEGGDVIEDGDLIYLFSEAEIEEEEQKKKKAVARQEPQLADDTGSFSLLCNSELLLVLQQTGSLRVVKDCALVSRRWRDLVNAELLAPLRDYSNACNCPHALQFAYFSEVSDSQVCRFLLSLSLLAPSRLQRVIELGFSVSSAALCHNITGTCLEAAAEWLPNLKKLCMWGCREVTNEGAHAVMKLTGLEVLDLRECSNIDDTGLTALPNLTNLKHLFLNTTRVTGQTLSLLPSLPKLKRLHLRRCHYVTADGYRHLAGLKALDWLDVSENPSAGQAMQHVGKLPVLRRLVARRAHMDNRAIRHLTHHPTLVHLDVKGNREVNDLCLGAMWHMPAVMMVNFNDCKVTEEGLHELRFMPRFKGARKLKLELKEEEPVVEDH